MSSPMSKKLRNLAAQYLAGRSNSEEKQAIEHYYDLFDEAPGIEQKIEPAEEARIGEEVFSRILQKRERKVVPLHSKTWLRIAVSVLLVASVITTWMIQNNRNRSAAKIPMAVTMEYKPVAFTRNIVLPDGSSIVLHDNSSLVVSNHFHKGNTREVTLTGEAFFDVKHNPLRPFIIHTGKIKTTVLGTAFNISAYPGRPTVSVSVLRGKVKVESNNNLLAILTPNKQLTTTAQQPEKQHLTATVNASQSIAWAASEMTFEDMAFKNLAALLERRYGVTITFSNPALERCHLNGAFTGKETLEEVLNILSETRGTTFDIRDHHVIISGQGCDE